MTQEYSYEYGSGYGSDYGDDYYYGDDTPVKNSHHAYKADKAPDDKEGKKTANAHEDKTAPHEAEEHGTPLLPKDASHPDAYMPPNAGKNQKQYMLRWDADAGHYALVGEKDPKSGAWIYYDKAAFDEHNKKGGKKLPPGQDRLGTPDKNGNRPIIRHDGASGKNVVVGFQSGGAEYYLPDGETVDLVNDVTTGEPAKEGKKTDDGVKDPDQIPPGKDPEHPDMTLPPFNSRNPNDPKNPKKVFDLKWDPKTGGYVITGEKDTITNIHRDYDLDEFKAVNKTVGHFYSPPVNQKTETVGGNTLITATDSKTKKDEIIGVQIGGKNYYFKSREMVNTLNLHGKKILTKIPDKNDPDHPDVLLPPQNAYGGYPPVQYKLRWDPDNKAYVTIESYSLADNRKPHTYSLAEFKAANKALESPVPEKPALPDPDHPDFTSYDAASKQVFVYRYDKDQGKYQVAGFRDKQGKTFYLDAASLKKYNQNAWPPKSPQETMAYDMPPNGGVQDIDIPPKDGKSDVTYVLRYNSTNDTWFIVGENVKKDGKWTFQQYDANQFDKANKEDQGVRPKSHKGEFESGDPPLICVTNPSTQKTEVIGIKLGDRHFYFGDKTAAKLNHPLKSDKSDKKDSDTNYTPNDLSYPQGDPPEEGEGYKKGHMDFQTTEGDWTYLWRWDDSVKRYCCVGTISHGDYDMWNTETYRAANHGKDGKRPPKDATPPSMPAFSQDPNDSQEEVMRDWKIDVTGSPGKGEKSGGHWREGYPITKKLQNGKKVIVGFVYNENNQGEKKHYFTKAEFDTYNPNGEMVDPKDHDSNKSGSQKPYFYTPGNNGPVIYNPV